MARGLMLAIGLIHWSKKSIENKAVEQLLPLHEAQLLTYMRLRNLRLGFLLNWNVVLMKNGIKRMVNGL